MKDNLNNMRFNERKYVMLSVVAAASRSGKYLNSRKIADLAEMTPNNTSRQLTKLAGQGYLWRKLYRATALEQGEYRYGHLKPMGERVLQELWIRNRLKEETIDPKIVLNLKKPIPEKHLVQYYKIKKFYYAWRWGLYL